MERLALGSIRNKLALVFFAITLGVVVFIYLFVVPRLETTLREQKLAEIQKDAERYSNGIDSALRNGVPAQRLAAAVRRAGERSNSRVTLLGVRRGTQGIRTTDVRADSSDPKSLDDLQFAVALDAARTRRPALGFEASAAGRLGQAALPIRLRKRVRYVVVYSQPLGDVQENVALIRRRVLIAGAIALALALLAGSYVASRLARRMKRLERAAEQVASGDFSASIPVDSDDELGQLARAFNEMQAQLAQLDGARKQFIATASHELRTPIFSLGGFIELLQDEDLDEETRERFLEQLRQQVQRLQKLAIELLDLSKLEAGSLELRPEPVDVGDLARDVAGEFTPKLAQHDSHLELRLSRRPIEAVCDPERVAQIVRILIDNALTHTPSGTDVLVTAARENGHVRLAVRDRGTGINRSEIPRIFEAFYTSNDAQGSGLGLKIASELAERMEGRLSVQSTPGETTFTLELPT